MGNIFGALTRSNTNRRFPRARVQRLHIKDDVPLIPITSNMKTVSDFFEIQIQNDSSLTLVWTLDSCMTTSNLT